MKTQNLQPIALTRTDAAHSLAMSVRSFDRHVLPHVKVVRRGNLVLVPVRELERWVEHEAEHTI